MKLPCVRIYRGVKAIVCVIPALLFFISASGQAFPLPLQQANRPPQQQQKKQNKTPPPAPQIAKPAVKYDPITEPAAVVKPRNLKIIDEHSDGNGYIVRTIQYDQGLMRVTETVFMPEKLKVGTRVAIRADTMKKELVEVIVDKKNYSVSVMYRKRMVRAYKAVFGPHPLQDKIQEGDRCTPEGWFKIVNKNGASHYDKFMLLSYPNDSAIARFNRLKARGQLPSSARIGGSVGIHGIWPGGDDLIEMGVGWTDGCVALKNKDIEELFAMVGIGTRVHILK